MKWKCDRLQQESRKTSRTRGRKTATKALQFGWFWAHGIKEMCPGKGDRWKTLDRKSTLIVDSTGLRPVLHTIEVMPEQNIRQPPPACVAALPYYMKLAVPA